MRIVFIILAFIVLFIVGEILGLLMHCENSSILRAAKPFIWCVPIIQAELFVLVIIDSFKKKSFKMLFAFFRIGETGLIILGSISYEVEAIKAKTKAKPKSSGPIIRKAPERARITMNACA